MTSVTDEAPRPAWPLSAAALFAIFAATVVLGVNLFGQTESREFWGYLLLLVLGPFAGGLLSALLGRNAAAWQAAARRILLLAAATLLLLGLAALLRQVSGVPLLPVAVALSLGSFLLLSLAVLADRLPAGLERRLEPLAPHAVPLLLAALMAFCALYTPLYPGKVEVSAFFAWIVGDPLFPILLLAAWPVGYLLPRLPKLRGGPLAWLPLALVLCLALLLYDDGHFIEYAHYAAYVGPALHALHGGVPMVEVYSQYGFLPWAVLSLVYHWLPETFGTAAVVVRLFTLAWFAVFVLTAYRLVEDKAVGLLLAAVGLIWAVTFHGNLFNLNALPSTEGYRYLLPQFAILFLAVARRGRERTLGLALLAGIASLTSIEAVVMTAGPVGALAFLTAVRDRSLRALLRDGLAGLAGIAAAQALLTLMLLVFYGRLPDYAPYLELTGTFEPGSAATAAWARPMPSAFGLWVPFSVPLFAVLALAFRDALAGRPDHPRAWLLVPAAVLAVGEASYYVGRSFTTTLGLALLPFLLVVLVGIDALLQRWRSRPARELRWERLLVGLAIAAVFAFSLERFARPYNPGKGNATILRHCFTEAGCAPATVLGRIDRAINEQAIELREDDPKNYVFAGQDLPERLSEILTLAHEDGESERTGLLVDTTHLPYLGVLAFTELGTWYRWPISSSDNDSGSSSLIRLILGSALPARDGEQLIVEKEHDILSLAERELFAQYQARCTLETVQQTRFYEVLRTRDCKN
ncbi:hypothetical protein SAMN06265365_107216 [Tistlia consotensis]|uniref:Chlor_Arch_YYY domain-containing protein n=1 Tax=Tistlia consotensis USBA 355 TaxID=560819 RepID=A0A1Y6BE53_9PROT|nr:hypothetical protein [Tistlia consotensis]SME98871.1 hypothetical protein SAMN05428998_102218 [Tistlia consotensis USBA 355]SNR58319.1 hypothetical protein SAMN06265365_107216 [Tistlia consotensis]